MIDALTATKACSALVGKELQYIYRSCDLIEIGFGDLFRRKNSRGTELTVATYSLHVQCPFRISDETTILVGSNDLFTPSNNNDIAVDLAVQNSSLFDLKICELDKYLKGHCVTSVTINKFGDLEVQLSNIRITMLSTTSTDDELWRFFETNAGKAHLVATGSGFEFDQ